MDNGFALEGFALAMKFTMDRSAMQRTGMRFQTGYQASLIEGAIDLFIAWRDEQERAIKLLPCVPDECDAEVRCLTCADVFCEEHFVDHLHDTHDTVEDSMWSLHA